MHRDVATLAAFAEPVAALGDAAARASGDVPLAHWLQLLWGLAPPLRASAAAPYIAAGAIHLPAQRHWRASAAAAAHAAAHLVYSPTHFDGSGLGPIARLLVALLEDARVEALAMRELPGLRRLWRPLHVASPDDGTGFDALLRRLARALADPEYVDPHPWVRKGCALFFIDAPLGLLGLRTPAEVRRAATLLGHDLGQMRLRPGPSDRCGPDYRDDHRWMWTADLPEPVAPPPRIAEDETAAESGGDATTPPPPAPLPEVVAWHPEWDRLIARLRPGWCRVVEQDATQAPVAVAEAVDDALRRAAHRLRGSVRALARHARAPRLAATGEWLDAGALVDRQVARRVGREADARVFRVVEGRAATAAVYVLVDQSVSTGETLASTGDTLLRGATRSAAALAIALRRAGIACAVAGFRSDGRQAVTLRVVQHFGRAADVALVARLAALRPEGSTRLGAALRHAAGRLATRPARRRWLLVLSDGAPHDVDIHDPRYLVEDARRAVRAARHRGLRVACLVLDPAGAGAARRVFGGRDAPVLRLADDVVSTGDALARALRGLR